MKAVLLRIGIDTGSGGIHGPLFKDGSFDYVPIPDRMDGKGVDERRYGNTVGRFGRELVQYFPKSKQDRIKDCPIHFDPEFESFTYGDTKRPKARLRNLEPGDFLIFYCGLQGFDYESDPHLYLMGYFEVEAAGRAEEFSEDELFTLFGKNFHVKHPQVFERQREILVLVKGSESSRMLKKAVKISAYGQDKVGKRLKILSPEMQKMFGNFGGKVSIQRCPPRWIEASHIEGTVEYIKSLE
jgi:hypothetical protein